MMPLHKTLGPKIILAIVFVIITAMSMYGALYLAENYFFDKLLYKKSWFHGYYYDHIYTPLLSMIGVVNTSGYRDSEFYPKQSDEFLILVSGDSNVWGVGVRRSQRFTDVLEKKLNTIRKTRVIALARGGTNLIEHIKETNTYKQRLNPDLIIFTFYENDLVIDPHQVELIDPSNFQHQEMIVSSDDDGEGNNYYSKVLGSYDSNTLNLELFKKIIDILDDNYLYYVLTYMEPKQHELMVEQALKKANLDVINNHSLFKEKYQYLTARDNNKPLPTLEISASEGHPNPVAHQMFAERVYQELTSNPRYGFVQQRASNMQ